MGLWPSSHLIQLVNIIVNPIELSDDDAEAIDLAEALRIKEDQSKTQLWVYTLEDGMVWTPYPVRPEVQAEEFLLTLYLTRFETVADLYADARKWYPHGGLIFYFQPSKKGWTKIEVI